MLGVASARSGAPLRRARREPKMPSLAGIGKRVWRGIQGSGRPGADRYPSGADGAGNRGFVSEDGPIAARTLGLVIGRHIDGGLHEDIEITNNSQKPVRFNLEIAIRADFADIFEVKGDDIVRRGRIITSWSEKREVLRITYRNRDFCREVIVRTGEGDGKPTVNAKGRLSFDIALKPGHGWHRCLTFDLRTA